MTLHRVALRLTLSSTVLVAAGCLFDPPERPRPTGWAGVLDTISTRLLPEFHDGRSWRLGPYLPPAPRLPRCAPATAPGETWRTVRVAGATYWLPGAVSARLPTGFATVFPAGAARDPYGVEHDPSRTIIATWRDTSGGDGMLTVTAGPSGGYGSWGVETTWRQVALAECASDLPVPGTAVVSFVAAGPHAEDGQLHVIQAVWPLAADRWVRVTASTRAARPGPDLATLRAIIESVRVVE